MKLHTLTTTTTDPRERGREIGTRFATEVRGASARYLAHFALLGIPPETVRETVDAGHAALRSWAPWLADESDAIAAAAGLDAWEVAAVGARTEVLAMRPAHGECTTAVRVTPTGVPETIQTWDWHDTLAPDGLLLALSTAAGRRVKLFTEFGTAAKIGVNDGGLGLHFNILSHRSDGVGVTGVPVHAIARRVLEEATTVAEAHEIAASARVSASTVLTVASVHDGAASIEMAPTGVALVAPDTDGWLVHTNHFLDPALAEGDTIPADAVSAERYAHTVRARAGMAAQGPAERAAAFCGGDGAEAVVCMRPDPSLPLHEQWGTLLTVSLDVAGFALDYRAGTPADAARLGLARF